MIHSELAPKSSPLETVPCGICGSQDSERLFDARDYLYGNAGSWPVSRCRRCGVVFLNPRIPPSEIGAYYPQTYYTHETWEQPGSDPYERALFDTVARRDYGYTALPPIAKEYQSYVRRRYPVARRNKLYTKIIDYIPNGRVLDVGCGNGYWLTRYHQLGWQVVGLEVDPVTAEVAQKAGHEVVVGELSDADFPDAAFDAITMWDSLEHIHNPVEIMSEVRRILKPDGALHLCIPNFGSWYGRVFQDRWMMFTAPVHYYHYNRETLTHLLTRCGFTDVSVRFPLGDAGFLPTMCHATRENSLFGKLVRSRPGRLLLDKAEPLMPRGHLHARALRASSFE